MKLNISILSKQMYTFSTNKGLGQNLVQWDLLIIILNLGYIRPEPVKLFVPGYFV